jgi:hypothetical protein
MGAHVHVVYLASILLLWLATYHAAYWLIAITRDPDLVCLSIGPFGVSIISLREPPVRRVLAQLVFAALALACVAYVSLFLVQPPPIAGLDRAPTAALVAIAVPVVALTATRLYGLIRDHLYPLWGEARVMTGVQRALATGARIYFTPSGRAFLRERFGATPHEFLRMVRL